MDKHYNFKKEDKRMQDLWASLKLYTYDPQSSLPLYSIDTPPPTVSGTLHMGHIFSYTQAEIIARFKRMNGYHVFYPFGFDDNGLPTERLVENVHGIKAQDMTREAFNALCMATTAGYEHDFKRLWQSLGFSVDWSLQYETISPSTQAIAQKSLLDLYHMKKAYVKESPVLWCTHCQTSIAQAELDGLEKETTWYDLKFTCDDQHIAIGTTRPEMLYGCVALFVNPEDPRYKHLIGKTAKVPLYGHPVPILADQLALTDKGTGIVMSCTYGDSTDLIWAEKYTLPYRETLTHEGRLAPHVPELAGFCVHEARLKIIKLLEAENTLLKTTLKNQTYQTHERCGHAIEILPSMQWYIDILTDQDRFIKAADDINWYPFQMKQRYLQWVKNLKWDWCISRQRYFGVPFPVWYCTACGTVKLAETNQLPVNPLTSQPTSACPCGCTSFDPEPAVMDTWMTSSLTPLINQKWGSLQTDPRLKTPMGLRTQAHEIIRTWAFYTIVKSLYHTGDIPWRDIMISGFVLAKKGEKISKSKNNALTTPQALIAEHSADAIRYWTAGNKLGTDTNFEPHDLAIPKRLMTKLWHAAKFTFMHLQDYKPSFEPALMPIDGWLIEKGHDMLQSMQVTMAAYEMGLARHFIDDYFWKDYCDDYLELVKERLYQPEKHGQKERQSAQEALYQSFLMVLKAYAIYMPHITEAIYQEFYAKKESYPSLHQHQWAPKEHIDSDVLGFGSHIKKILIQARKYKSENGLSMKSEMPTLTINIPQKHSANLMATLSDLQGCTHAETLEIKFTN